MSETFKASNGVPVRRTNTGTLSFARTSSLDLGTLTGISISQEEALREFFQHERDQELGRWRWPENPDMVVQADKGGERAWVVNERHQHITGCVWRVDVDCSTAHSQVVAAARAYFAAHPVPKPWMEVPEGVYAMRPDVHLYERLIMFRGGKWHHLYKSPSEAVGDPHSEEPEKVAEITFREGRLTRLVAEVSDA